MWDYLDKHPLGAPIYFGVVILFAWIACMQYAERVGR